MSVDDKEDEELASLIGELGIARAVLTDRVPSRDARAVRERWVSWWRDALGLSGRSEASVYLAAQAILGDPRLAPIALELLFHPLSHERRARLRVLRAATPIGARGRPMPKHAMSSPAFPALAGLEVAATAEAHKKR
jgi:hypothetical protein